MRPTTSAPTPPHPRPIPDATGTPDPDEHIGAVEGDKPNQRQHSNRNGDGIDDQGLPNDPVATAEDRIGANNDDSQG